MKKTENKSKKTVFFALIAFILSASLMLAQPAIGCEDCDPAPPSNKGRIEGSLEVRINLEESPAPNLFSRIKGSASVDVSARNNLDASLNSEGYVVQTGIENSSHDNGATKIRSSYGENEIQIQFKPDNVDRIEKPKMEYTTELGNRISLQENNTNSDGMRTKGGAEANHDLRVNLNTDFGNKNTTAGTNSQGANTVVGSNNQYFSAETQSQAKTLPKNNLNSDAYSVTNSGQTQVWGKASRDCNSVRTEARGSYSGVPINYRGNSFSETSFGMFKGENFQSFNAQTRVSGSIKKAE